MKIKRISFTLLVAGIHFLMQNCASVQSLVPVTGSVWNYRDHDRKYTLSFLENGVLRSTHPNDITPDNYKWWTSGDTLYFSFNDRFAVYYGVCYGPSKIKGMGRNNKKTWKYTLTR